MEVLQKVLRNQGISHILLQILIFGHVKLSKIGLKTLVLVHKEFLLTQWKDRIQEFLPDARIGEIQGKKCDVVDKDIVIVTKGMHKDKSGGTNLMKILRVGDGNY